MMTVEATNKKGNKPNEVEHGLQTCRHSSLPLFEITSYWVLLVSLLSYTMYRFFKASQDYKDVIYQEDLKEGWKILGGKKDITDYEWEFWLKMVQSLMPAMLIHMFGGLLCSYFFPQVKASYSLLFSILFLVYWAGVKPALFIIGHCLMMYACCVLFKSVFMVWACALLILASLLFNPLKFWQLQHLSPLSEIRNLTLYASLMSNLRCISFGLEFCWRSRQTAQEDKRCQQYSLMDFLLYNFYFPLFANGPVVTFDTFHKTFHQRFEPFSSAEVKSLVWDSVRTVWWYLFLEGYLNFMYSSAIAHDSYIFTSLSSWALTGLMYSQVNIFLVKYVVFYRCTGVFARVDRVDVPPPPRCVTTLNRFTDMWKFFDSGLNIWMKRYIYFPVGGSRHGIVRQIAGSFLAFTFVWIWHGGYMSTLWWFIPNWLGVVMESLAETSLLPAVIKWYGISSKPCARRIIAAFDALSLTSLILSNLVFLIGTDPVWFYIRKIFFHGFPTSPLLLLFSMYLMVQANL